MGGKHARLDVWDPKEATHTTTTDVVDSVFDKNKKEEVENMRDRSTQCASTFSKVALFMEPRDQIAKSNGRALHGCNGVLVVNQQSPRINPTCKEAKLHNACEATQRHALFFDGEYYDGEYFFEHVSTKTQHAGFKYWRSRCVVFQISTRQAPVF